MELAESLARRWMPGFRQGPGKRHAWEHPADLVRVLTGELPLSADPKEHEARVTLAWLHDILEDGRKPNGNPVTMYDLREEGIDPAIIEDVLAMTRLTLHGSGEELEPKERYLARLKEKSLRAKVVKCVDRICNLREGRETFKNRRWLRYVGETLYFIYPLTEDLPKGPETAWLKSELLRVAQARKIEI